MTTIIARIKSKPDTAIALLALVVSFVALVISYLAYSQPGTVQPFEPTMYGIIRGYESFPSDHIILPLEWQNTRGQPVLIKQPELILHEVDDKGQEIGTKYRFTLAGEFPEISSSAFREHYALKSSFIVEARSIPVKVLLFHYERWWDESGNLYNFQFKKGQKYNVYLKYQADQDQVAEKMLFSMPIFARIEELRVDHSTSWWDVWYLE